jgi:uncharacterized protein (DUF2141 family)
MCSRPGIRVTILNIRNNVGTVDCALFDSPNGFPLSWRRSGSASPAPLETPEAAIA